MSKIASIQCHLQQPLLISSNRSPGNLYRSLDYISGTVLWGAFAAIYLRQKNAKDDLFYRFFLSGKVRFGNCYFDNGIPIPQSYYQCKSGQAHHMHMDCLNTSHQWQCSTESCRLPIKPTEGYYQMGEKVKVQSPRFEIRMRNTLSPETFTTGEGSLYSYEPLRRMQNFGGLLTFQEDADWEKFQQLFADYLNGNKPLFLGKATHHGFGKVEVYVEETDELFPYLPYAQRWQKKNNFTLTLLSDTILPEIFMRKESFAKGIWLQDWLKLSGKLVLKNYFSTQNIVSGFSSVHQLPREKDRAIAKGSAFLFEHEVQDMNHLETSLFQLEQVGMGFRVAEGFGQIAVNLPIHWGQ